MDDAQLESAGLLEGVQGEAARAQRLDLLRQLLADGFSLGELQEAARAERLALLQPGDSEQTLGLRYAQAAEHLIPLLTPLLGYLLGVQFRDQVKRAYVMPTELSAGRFENAREVTVCFADLVGFTRLGERVAPQDLSSAGRRLTDLAVAVARPPVRLVKDRKSVV